MLRPHGFLLLMLSQWVEQQLQPEVPEEEEHSEEDSRQP